MARLRVSTLVDADLETVWADISDLGSHVEWMRDAVELRFTSSSTQGVGTSFECETRVGPFRTLDRMEITEWVEPRVIGVRHRGVVSGEGAILLRARRDGRTRVIWRERLRFPWWMGGPLGGLAAKPILHLVWRGSMRNLARRFSERTTEE